MRFAPRTNEADYVDIRPTSHASTDSAGSFGRAGRVQTARFDGSCGLSGRYHKLGHVIGLFHEHSRPDRAGCLRFFPENARPHSVSGGFTLTGDEDCGDLLLGDSFDYGYNLYSFRKGLQPTFETIPPGTPVGSADTPSVLDDDSVNRLYGATPRRLSIASNPPLPA